MSLQNYAPTNGAWVDPVTGKLTRAAQIWLRELWLRTGGVSGGVSTTETVAGPGASLLDYGNDTSDPFPIGLQGPQGVQGATGQTGQSGMDGQDGADFWFQTTPRLNETLVPNGSVEFGQQQGLQFRIENRTSDPSSPATGEIWLRTDL